MINSKIIEELTQKIMRVLPSNLGIIKEDFEKNVRSAVQATIAKFNLVTREEFDIQAKALARAQEKLESLQKTVEELESHLHK